MISTKTNNQIITSQKPIFLFLVGLMGCGKTYWGQSLAAKNHFNFIDLDKAIEEKLSSSISQIFTTKGEFFFREKETEVLQEVIIQTKNTIVATGGGTACFNENIRRMNENGITIWLNSSIESIVERTIGAKLQRPLIADIPNQSLFNFFTNQLNDRREFYSQSKHCLNSNEINEINLQKIIDQYV